MSKPPPATYWVVEARLTPEAEELWALFCTGMGAAGGETVSETPSEVTVRFFFDFMDATEADLLLDGFCEAFPGVAAPFSVRAYARPVENWQEGWRVFFSPLPIGQTLMVCPPWEIPTLEALAGRRPLLIDPGQGFGTGGHASTALALELLERALGWGPPPRLMLDVGIGSGILAIAGLLLGVGEVVGLDVDGRVMGDVGRNFALNALPEPPVLVHGTPECLVGAFPLVTANLTTPVLLEHRRALAGLTAPAGWLILSGILDREAPEILEAFTEQGMYVVETKMRDGWFAALCRLQD